MGRRSTRRGASRTGRMGLGPSPVITQMRALLSFDPYLGSFKDIATRVQRLEQAKRHQLLLMGDSVFSDITLRKDEPTRVATAKVMIALVHESV